MNRLRKIWSNANVKVMMFNFLSLSSLQLVNILLPLITLPYILRVIGFTKYGIIIFSLSFITYFYSITDFSFKITATRDVAIFKKSKRKLDIIYSKVLIIKTIFMIASFLIIGLSTLVFPKLFEYRLTIALSSLMLLGYTLFPEWFFQGIEKMKYITFLNVGVKVFFTGCVFLFIKKEEDYWLYPLFQSCGFLGAGFIGQYLLIKKYKLKFIWLPLRSIEENIKKNIPIFVTQFLPNLYNTTSTFLLGLFSTPMFVGIYDSICRIVGINVVLQGIVSRVVFPYLNRNKDSFLIYRKLYLRVSFLLIMIPIVFSKLIIWYLDIRYEHTLLLLIILSLGVFFHSVYDVYGLNYFIVNREDKIVMKNTIVSSILGFILAFPLIQFFGIIGASINLSVSRLFMGGGLYYQYYKKQRS